MKLTHYQCQRLAISAAADESRAFRQTFKPSSLSLRQKAKEK